MEKGRRGEEEKRRRRRGEGEKRRGELRRTL
jgi:hypothetical protein